MIASFGIAQLVDAVIAFTVLECAVLASYHRITSRGVAPRDFLLNVVSGLCLMLALRCLVRDAGAAWIALCLLAAGAAHGADLWRRWLGSERNAVSARRMIA
jgi:hypothetical protein